MKLVGNALSLLAALLIVGLPARCEESSVDRVESKSQSGASQSSASQSQSGESRCIESLEHLNERFRSIYGQAKARSIARSKPLIIVYSDRIQLIDNDRTEESCFIPERYTILKTIDHIPLALYSLLHDRVEKPLSPKVIKELQQFKALSMHPEPFLPELNLPPVTLARQRRLISDSAKFIDQTIRAGIVTEAELTAFCRAQSSPLLENAYEAVSGQLENIDRQVTLWRSQLGPDKWARLKVVIIGGHMPREKQSTFQYFSKLLKEKREGDRIIFSEGPQEQSEALNLLGTHVLDEGVAVSFFNDKWRMHRDLLSDGAERYLRKHPPGTAAVSKSK